MIKNPIAILDPYWAIDDNYGSHALRLIESVGMENLTTLNASFGSGNGDDPPYSVVDGVAIVSISGPLTKHMTCANWLVGGTSTKEARMVLRQAAKDETVSKIALIIDSPGGQVSGTGDLADVVAEINQSKPIYAYVEDMCASAAYWIGSQATKITANPTAMVGSIGTYMVVYDSSRMANAEGVQVHVIRAGEFKGAGTPGTKITEQQIQEFQKTTNDLNAQFLAGVARGRGMTAEQVKQIADGRCFVGDAALNIGLVDAIGSFDAFMQDLKADTGHKPNDGDGNDDESSPDDGGGDDGGGNEGSALNHTQPDSSGVGENSVMDTPNTSPKEKLVAWLASSDEPAIKQLAKELENMSGGALPEEVKAEIKTLQATNQTLLDQIATLKSDSEKRSNQEASKAADVRIEQAVKDMKLQPSKRENMKALFDTDAKAFDAAMGVIEEFEAITKVRTVNASTLVDEGGSGSTKQLQDLAKAYAKEHSVDYVTAFKTVSDAHPKLAKDAREEQNANAGGEDK